MKKLLRVLFVTITIMILCFFITIFLLNWIFPFPKDLLEKEHISLIVADRKDKYLMCFLDEQECWNFPITLTETNSYFIHAIISVEDKKFYRHCGIDFVALIRAFIGNITGIYRYSGASTITMQTIRLLEPRPIVLKSKIIEMFRAWQLEKILSKKKILEIYLNHTPYGGNIIGIESAARRYFDKNAYELSLAQASLLAGLPQYPSGYRPDKYLPRAFIRQKYVLYRMFQDGYITLDQFKNAMKEEIQISSKARSFEAPHFCYMLKKYYPNKSYLKTTLDSKIQMIAQKVLEKKLKDYQDIENGAILVVENKTGAVRAWVGSNNFFDCNIQGQVNGVKMKRSPGSLLKPFTYTLGIDKSLATPASVFPDVPITIGNYSPENYDKNYRGIVSLKTALTHSLNIPAVIMQQKIGTQELLEFLRKIGLTSLKKKSSHYGLSLTLGSCETSLWELVEAYSTLARMGLYQPLKFLEDDIVSISIRTSSESACYMINSILSNTEPFYAAKIHVLSNSPSFSWKTGTSAGNRDAWAILYNPEYTVGVWLGNFNGRSSTSLVGLTSAAPIAYSIFMEICSQNQWYPVPKGISKRMVCEVSGDIPKPGICKNLIEDWYIPGVSPEYYCRVHEQVYINKEGFASCPACQSKDDPLKTVENWELYVQKWLEKRGDRNLKPRHNPNCSAKPSEKLMITSPVHLSQYVIRNGESGHVSLSAFGNSDKLYWFENDTLLGCTQTGETMNYALKKGTFDIQCVDEKGQKDVVTILVK